MVAKTYNKSVLRMLRSNIIRLFSISLIITIGISLLTSICGLPERIRNSQVSNPGDVYMIEALADKVELLGYIFPAFFIAIAALTALTTITRLIEEERLQIACLKTLGFSSFSIMMKYIIFAFVCVTLGCTLGVIIGNYVFLPILYNSMTTRFDISSTSTVDIIQGAIWSACMTVAVISVTIFSSRQKCREKPAVLLRGKSPKAGKKIFLEYMPLIWKPLKFKYKSSVRNIFRYKSRLVMTILSVIGCTAILFCGIGIFGSLENMHADSANDPAFVDSIKPVSVFIIIFGAALAVLVLFNLTNINIEERKREIATLRVLGYSRFEVAGYVYREVTMLSIAGILAGVPLGYGLLGFVFDFVEFGSLEYVEWYIWLITAAASFFTVILADALLYRKIKKIDMTSSLKTVD